MTEHIYRICDVKDEKLLRTIFEKYRPQIVFHAAAHKHVPLMEFNEAEALQNMQVLLVRMSTYGWARYRRDWQVVEGSSLVMVA